MFWYDDASNLTHLPSKNSNFYINLFKHTKTFKLISKPLISIGNSYQIWILFILYIWLESTHNFEPSFPCRVFFQVLQQILQTFLFELKLGQLGLWIPITLNYYTICEMWTSINIRCARKWYLKWNRCDCFNFQF